MVVVGARWRGMFVVILWFYGSRLFLVRFRRACFATLGDPTRSEYGPFVRAGCPLCAIRLGLRACARGSYLPCLRFGLVGVLRSGRAGSGVVGELPDAFGGVCDLALFSHCGEFLAHDGAFVGDAVDVFATGFDEFSGGFWSRAEFGHDCCGEGTWAPADACGAGVASDDGEGLCVVCCDA